MAEEGGSGMWPKLLLQYLPQLVELLPHVRRVVPMADKFLERGSAQQAQFDALATGIRDDLGKVAKAHVEMARHLDGFAGHIAGIEREVHAAASAAEAANQTATREAERATRATEALDARLTRLERSVASQRMLQLLLLVCALAVVFLLIAVLVRQH